MNPDDYVASSLRDPLLWPMTPLVRQSVLSGMANRAVLELQQVDSGVDIIVAHGEAAAAYYEYEWWFKAAAHFLRLNGHRLQGRAADLGSGTGVAACVLSKFTDVREVFAVEYSKVFTTRVMPVVFRRFGGRVEKIQRVVGDFNALQFDDGSVDVIAEINSFHHSEALDTTLGECWRVLRPGGILIAIDRAWPDSFSREELEDMLDRQLADELRPKYGIHQSTNFTRRDWGEHEYRVCEWMTAFEKQGFDAAVLVQGAPDVRAVKRLLSSIPSFRISVVLAAIAYCGGKRRLRIYGWNPQEKVIFICMKPKGSQRE